MLAKLRPRSVYDILAAIGCFAALTTGVAYAAETIGTDDVINDSLLGEDIKQATVRGGDIALNTIATSRLTDNSLLSVDVQDGTLTAADILNGTIGASDIAANSLGGGRITDNSLKGTDIDESSLAKVGDAETLDGRSADDFSRTALGSIISYTNEGTLVEKTSVVIDAPRDGLMLVMGSASIGTLINGDTSCNPCMGVIRLRDAVNDATGTEQVATFGDGAAEASAQLATSWVFEVEAGRREFALDALTSGAPGDIFVDNPTVSVLFVPFGRSGDASVGAVTAKTARERRG
jgi:hypothetical protein